jgi:hypothetical protein
MQLIGRSPRDCWRSWSASIGRTPMDNPGQATCIVPCQRTRASVRASGGYKRLPAGSLPRRSFVLDAPRRWRRAILRVRRVFGELWWGVVHNSGVVAGHDGMRRVIRTAEMHLPGEKLVDFPELPILISELRVRRSFLIKTLAQRSNHRLL